MTRVKSGVQTKRRHKKVLKEASGYLVVNTDYIKLLKNN